MRLRRLSLLSVLGVCGCGSPTAPSGTVADGYEDCTSGGGFAFSVRVKDARTSQALVLGSSAEWTAGLSRGTLSLNPPKFPNIAGGEVFIGPYGRPGSLSIVITRPGYGTWRRSIVVPQGPQHCDVIAVGEVTALLRPT